MDELTVGLNMVASVEEADDRQNPFHRSFPVEETADTWREVEISLDSIQMRVRHRFVFVMDDQEDDDGRA